MEGRGFKIFVIDNRRHRRGATKAATEFTLNDLAADIAGGAGIMRRRRGAAHIFGISMGGMIAQEFVLTYPEAARGGLVLGCTNCGSSHSMPADPAADRQT